MTSNREILRLYSRAISQRSIAISCQCSRNTVAKVLRRAEVNLKWLLPSDMDDSDLEELLFQKAVADRTQRRLPDLDYIHKEMLKAGSARRLRHGQRRWNLQKAHETVPEGQSADPR